MCYTSCGRKDARKLKKEIEMMNCRRWIGLAALVVLMSLAACAIGESARIVTPGGPLNMRRNADEKSKLVDTVPNKALVEVVESGETWCKITYKKKTGYVRTEYVKLPSSLVGQTVYSDEGTVLMRLSPDEDAPITAPVGCNDPVVVLEAAGEWLRVSCNQAEGFVPALSFSYQNTSPAGKTAWIREPGVLVKDTVLFSAPSEKAAQIGQIEAGEAVTVTALDGDFCLAVWDEGCGYVPKQAVCLSGPEDSDERAEEMTPMEAARLAEDTLKKAFKRFAAEKLYCVMSLKQEDGAESPLYHCGFFNEHDQYLYGALVEAKADGEVLFTGHYNGFSVLVRQKKLLPAGQVEAKLSAENLAIGQVLDVSVEAWTDHQVQYTVSKDGKTLFSTELCSHFNASYRPRQEGNYTLDVRVRSADGESRTVQLAFTVAGESQDDDQNGIYSQKDGWWKDKKYRHSNLGKSGCAIFALSHALRQLGHTEESILPENLAVKYAYCLIPGEGTSNELLINTAARDYGFKTQKQLIADKKKIAELISGGTVFSFSIAKGHIAMVSGISEDLSMIRVIDSAPRATFERITGAAQYYQMRSGAFRAALSLDDLPGARWYMETDDYGGLEYWLPIDYVAKRGVRLIQPIAEQGEER